MEDIKKNTLLSAFSECFNPEEMNFCNDKRIQDNFLDSILQHKSEYESIFEYQNYAPPNKEPKELEELLDLLRNRGLIISNEKLAKEALLECQYYRLMAYRFLFVEENDKDRFKENVKFENIWDLYVFDRRLRFLIINAIERIEVSLRSRWAYILATKHNALAYEDFTIHHGKYYEQVLNSIYTSILKSKELCIRHFIKPEEPNLEKMKVPIWAVCEVLTFGQLETMISSLKEPKLRNAILREYGLDEKVMISFLNIIRNTRNICAHHGRLWNRRLFSNIKFPKNPTILAESLNNPKTEGNLPKEEIQKKLDSQKSIYNVLTILAYLVDKIRPQSRWKRSLVDLLQAPENQLYISEMGFPDNWTELPLWKKIFTQ